MLCRLVLLAFAACVLGAIPPYNASVPPSQDAFYKPPAGYKKHAPGAVLRYRQVPNNFDKSLPNITVNVAATYQILFRTTDSFGNHTAAVTTLFVPSVNPDPLKHLAYLIPYDTPDADCAPSYAVEAGAIQGIPNAQGNALLLLIAAGINKGWYVSTPDHEGLKGAQAVFTVSGQTTLDSMRAVTASGPVTGIAKQAQSVTWGYSGGAIPAAAAAELQASYAPDVNFIGSAIGGFGLTQTAQEQSAAAANPKRDPGKLINVMLGLSNEYPNMTTYLSNQLLPATAAKFRTGQSKCTIGTTFSNTSLDSYFRHPKTAITAPIPASLLGPATSAGYHGTPVSPIYFNQAIHDGLIPIGQADALVQLYCGQGAVVNYVRDSVNNHVHEGIAGAAGEFQYLIDRFDGVALPNGTSCSVEQVSTNGMPESESDLFGDQIYQALKNIFEGV